MNKQDKRRRKNCVVFFYSIIHPSHVILNERGCIPFMLSPYRSPYSRCKHFWRVKNDTRRLSKALHKITQSIQQFVTFSYVWNCLICPQLASFSWRNCSFITDHFMFYLKTSVFYWLYIYQVPETSCSSFVEKWLASRLHWLWIVTLKLN